MAKATDKMKHQKCASAYEKICRVEGTFEDMIAISIIGAGVKKTANPKQ